MEISINDLVSRAGIGLTEQEKEQLTKNLHDILVMINNLPDPDTYTFDGFAVCDDQNLKQFSKMRDDENVKECTAEEILSNTQSKENNMFKIG